MGGWVCSDEQVYPEVSPLQYTAFGVPGVEILPGVIRCNYEACELLVVFPHSLIAACAAISKRGKTKLIIPFICSAEEFL